MKTTSQITAFLWMAISMFSCNSGNQQNKDPKDSSVTRDQQKQIVSFKKIYTTLSVTPLETPGKAQVKVMAYLTNGFTSKEDLSNTLNILYETYRHKDGFQNFTEPTVVGVYLFETKKLASSDPSAWLAMLIKGPSDDVPNISYNDLKVNASLGLNDKALSEDEIQLAKIKKLLSSRHLDMCDLNQTINKIELDAIHDADRTYPDYGSEHDQMADRIIEKEWKKLEKKYKLTEAQINRATMFASTYCK